MSDAGNSDLVMQQLANAGIAMAYFASCFPPSLEIAEIMPRGIGGPFSVGAAAGKWQEGASALQEIQSALTEACTGLSADSWSGDDRTGFDAEVKNLAAELGDSHNYANAVGVALEVCVAPLAIWGPGCLTIGLPLAALAASFYIEAASVVGDLGPSEATEAAGTAAAAAFLTAISASSIGMIAILGAAALTIGISDAADITAQKQHGNNAILGDFGQAQVDGLGELATNAGEYFVGKGLDKVGDHFDGITKKGEQVVVQDVRRAVGVHVGVRAAEVAKEQAVERGHAAKSLQELINDMSGWDGGEE